MSSRTSESSCSPMRSTGPRLPASQSALRRRSPAMFTMLAGSAAPLAMGRWPSASQVGYGGVGPTYVRKPAVEEAGAMNGYAIFAFVITPAIVLVLGYIALRL